MNSFDFKPLSRQKFRRYFQPSRILLAIIPADNKSGVNIITLCFTMHCSYKPPMLAMAIHNINASYALIQSAEEYVLAVPGEKMIREAMFCGTKSMTEVPDKVLYLGLDLVPSSKIAVPGLGPALANIEMVKHSSLKAGDHLLVVGRAVSFGVRTDSVELPLLSIGPDTTGYRVLAQQGIHRVGTVELPTESSRQ